MGEGKKQQHVSQTVMTTLLAIAGFLIQLYTLIFYEADDKYISKAFQKIRENYIRNNKKEN